MAPHQLLLYRLKDGENPLQVPLVYADFWVLVHNIPYGFMSAAMANQLGNFIGSFVEYDSTAISSDFRGIMRIRVSMDISKPLKRRKKLGLLSGISTYISFQYEKLKLFCFLCGRLGHGEAFCPVRLSSPTQELSLEWDISLRAPPRGAVVPTSIWLREDSSLNFPIINDLSRGGNQVWFGYWIGSKSDRLFSGRINIESVAFGSGQNRVVRVVFVSDQNLVFSGQFGLSWIF
ncbi:hypothetical protein GQ457_01G027980 [Hibiscus cannabinus]